MRAEKIRRSWRFLAAFATTPYLRIVGDVTLALLELGNSQRQGREQALRRMGVMGSVMGCDVMGTDKRLKGYSFFSPGEFRFS